MISGIGGTMYHPLISGFITALGAVFGELLSYFVGSTSQHYIPDSEWNTKVKEFMKINGSFTIFILSIIPNPFFDIAGITAGATNFPLWKFIFFSFFGKWIKFSIFALMGKKLNNMLK
jgi:membrane protein DedA with SNARE-associated domain